MKVVAEAVDRMTREEVAEIASNARRRWHRLLDMGDHEVVEHVFRAMSEEPKDVMGNLRDLYRTALIAGASDLHLAGLAVAANSVASDLGLPRPDWTN